MPEKALRTEANEETMSFTLWFTGLSGAGKSTLSRKVYYELRRRGLAAELLDGDLIRNNFGQELGFSKKDRDINVRRIGFVSHLLSKHDVISVVAAIAPYREAREANRALIGDYVEVFVNCPLEVTEKRDPKGLYARARTGEISNFTGVSDPYEAPPSPEIEVFTDRESVEDCYCRILEVLERSGRIPAVTERPLCLDAEREEAIWRNRLADLGFAKGCLKS
jgi:adenylylsulfate kinase